MNSFRYFHIRAAFALAAILLGANPCLAGEANKTVGTKAARPKLWAVKLNKPGLPNLYLVTTNLFRGAQPTATGMTNLSAMGIKAVINLRTFHSDKDKVAGTGLKSFRFETKPWHGEEEDVIGFLKIVTDTNNLPAFVHCQRGADRTGLMCAMYRITVCGWSKSDAIAEMKDGGFNFNPVWKNLVTFIEKSDIADIKLKAGLSGKQKSEVK